MSTLKSDTIQSVGSNLVFANSAATETMRITSAGNVGVGTNSPTSLLHVAGTALITGAASLSSTLNVSGLATLAGATSSAIISCGTAPTLGQHLANKTYVDSFNRIGSVICCLITYADSSSSAHLLRYGITKTANTYAFTLPTGSWTGFILNNINNANTATNTSGLSTQLIVGSDLTLITYSNATGTLTGGNDGLTTTNNATIPYWGRSVESVVINLVRTA